MKKIKIGKYYYTRLEIIIYTILKWIIGIIVMLSIIFIPCYLIAIIEKNLVLIIPFIILDLYLICKMLYED